MRFSVLAAAALLAIFGTSEALADSNLSHKAANGAHAEISVGWACKNSGYKAQIYDLSLQRAEALLEGGGYSATSAKVLVDTYRKQAEAGRGALSTIPLDTCDRVWQSLEKPATDKSWMGNLPACKATVASRPAWCPAAK